MAQHDRLRLERVQRKYRLLLELRLERDAAEQEGRRRFEPPHAERRRTRLHALAEEYPGSLREMEASTIARLQLRLSALESALARHGAEPGWAVTVDAFHLVLRQALATKRWLVDRIPRGGQLDERLVRDFDHDHPHLPRRLTLDELHAHLRPPKGRLLNLVWAALDESLGRNPAELERDVYG